MGSNSNRTRQPCKVAGCDGMSRAMSGLCVTHRQVPVEQVKLRDFTAADVLGCADSARVGNWTAAGKARREAELLRRRAQWASEATQTPQTVSDATTSVIASPAGSECASCGLEHCGTHADGGEVVQTSAKYEAVKDAITAIVGLTGAVAICYALWLAFGGVQ